MSIVSGWYARQISKNAIRKRYPADGLQAGSFGQGYKAGAENTDVAIGGPEIVSHNVGREAHAVIEKITHVEACAGPEFISC